MVIEVPHEATNGNGHGHGRPAEPAHGFATRAVHVGSETALSASGGVNPAIEMSTTYAQSSVGQHKGFEYSRSSNPTRLALERLLASLEGADVMLAAALRAAGHSPAAVAATTSALPAAVALSSGSAATASVVSALAGPGGHVLSVGDVYGGSSRYMLRVAAEVQSVETTFVDMAYREPQGTQVGIEEMERDIEERVVSAIRPNTKLIWAETPTNPLLTLVPIRLIARIAHARGIPLVVDNTFASPYYQRPLALGADVVVHSITKYIGGHSDVLGGVIITPDPALLEKFRFRQNTDGAVPSPFDSWLVIRSIKTLPLRARQHGLNALAIARYLHEVALPRGLIRDVRYPGLRRAEETPTETAERHLAWEQLSPEARKWALGAGYSRDGEAGFPWSGMVSFHIASSSPQSQHTAAAAEAFLSRLSIFTLAESLGGVESLAELPLKMTHAGVDPERRRDLGIDGELVRLSVGIEEVEDLVDDLDQALRAAVGQAKNEQ